MNEYIEHFIRIFNNLKTIYLRHVSSKCYLTKKALFFLMILKHKVVKFNTTKTHLKVDKGDQISHKVHLDNLITSLPQTQCVLSLRPLSFGHTDNFLVFIIIIRIHGDVD